MKKVFSNFLYQASYQVLLIILPVVTIPIVSTALGKEGIGTYNFISSIVNYFVLVAGLGLANYGVREIAIVRDNRKKLSEKFWELQLFNLFFSLSSLILFLFFAVSREEERLYLVQSMVVLATVFDISWFFSGIENFKKITIRNFIIKIITFLLIFFLIKTEQDLLKYFIIQGGGTLLGSLSLWINLTDYVDFTKIKIKNIFLHFVPAVTYFIAKIAISLYQNLTKTILGLVVSIGALGLYANAMSLITMTGSIINAMNTVMIPRMSKIANSGGKEDIIPILVKVIHLQIYITIAMSFGIAGISGTLVPWFFGPDFKELILILPVLSPVLIFQSLQMSIATQYLIPFGKMKEYNLSVILGALVSVLTTLLLSLKIGVFGAVVGISFGYMTICVIRSYKLIKSTTFRYNWIELGKYLISGIVMMSSVYLLGLSLTPTIGTTFLQILVGGIIYMGISLALKANPLYTLFFRKRR